MARRELLRGLPWFAPVLLSDDQFHSTVRLYASIDRGLSIGDLAANWVASSTPSS